MIIIELAESSQEYYNFKYDTLHSCFSVMTVDKKKNTYKM